MKNFILLLILCFSIGCGATFQQPAPQLAEHRTAGLDPLFIPFAIISDWAAHDGQTTIYLKTAEGEKDSKNYLIFGPMAHVQSYDDGLLIWILGVN